MRKGGRGRGGLNACLYHAESRDVSWGMRQRERGEDRAGGKEGGREAEREREREGEGEGE